MKTTINNRLKEYIELNNINPPDFYHKVGASRMEYFSWMNESRPIPLRYLLAILNFYPNLNARWLLLGDGNSTEINESSGSGDIRIDDHLSVTFLMDQIGLLKDHISSLKDNIIGLKGQVEDNRFIIDKLNRELDVKNLLIESLQAKCGIKKE